MIHSLTKRTNETIHHPMAVGAILTAGTLWGCQGLFSRALTALGIATLPVLAVRMLGSCAILGVLFLLRDRSGLRIRPRDLLFFAVMGVGSVLSMTLLYYQSQQVSSLATAAILLYTSPTVVVLLSALIWRERIGWRKLAALVLAFLGCAFVAGILEGALVLSARGLLLGLGSSLTYASYTLFTRHALKRYGPLTVLFYAFLFAGTGALVLCPTADLVRLGTTGGALPLALGMMVLCTILPFLLYTRGLARLEDGGRAAILASIEPVAAALVGIVAFGEPLTASVALGLICVLGAVALLR